MTHIHVIILGIVEGITEFLPISSTAHLDIVRVLLSLPSTEFMKSFQISIQLGAILAVVVIYGKKILMSFKIFRALCIAFIPTGVVGFLLYKIIKEFLLGNILLAGIMLLLGGIVIVLFESFHKENPDGDMDIASLPIKTLLVLGIAQALAVVPGVSRSGAVIIAGRSMKLPRKLIVEFSFLLAIPTMLAATMYDLLKSGFSFTTEEWGIMATGFLVSFIVALGVVVWLLKYIQKHSFSIFGWYRIILGILIIWVSLTPLSILAF